MSFHAATPGGPNQTITDCWLTPQFLIDKIGISELDPCAWLPGGSPIIKTANNYFTEQDDGLTKDWSVYDSVFVNFPYSESRRWMEKCAYHGEKGVEIIVLCFVRSDTKAWVNVRSATGINLIHKRIKFLNHEGIEKSNGNAPSCLIAWGEKAHERIKNVDGICARIDKD